MPWWDLSAPLTDCVLNNYYCCLHYVLRPSLDAQELEVITLAATALLSKYRKMATFDEFLSRLFFHGKAAVTVLLFLVGVAHVVSYLMAWIGEFRVLFSLLCHTLFGRHLQIPQIPGWILRR